MRDSDATLNAAWSRDGSRFGARLLQRMGWKGPGTGLGAREDGAAEHVAVRRRSEGSALGADAQTAGVASAVQDFNAVLAAVAASLPPPPPPPPAPAPPPAEDVSEARAAKRRRRAERAAAAAAGEAGADVPAPAPAPVLAPAPAPAERVVARARASYSKVSRNKRVEAYSAADLAAILGGRPL